VSQGREDILTAAIGTKEHPGRVRAARFGVEVRQYFGSAPRSSLYATLATNEQLAQMGNN